jgi:hypothetical protein
MQYSAAQQLAWSGRGARRAAAAAAARGRRDAGAGAGAARGRCGGRWSGSRC